MSRDAYSNGGLDPWSGGGVLMDLSPSLVSIIIPEGAHHLDLRASNPADPPSVTAARQREKSIIKQWIEQHRQADYQVRPAVHFLIFLNMIILRGLLAGHFGL